MSEQALRIKGFEEIDESRICYWHTADGWLLYLPKCGVGNLKLHSVNEHEDGTISATPSILVTGHDAGQTIQRHGYLTRGIWSEV